MTDLRDYEEDRHRITHTRYERIPIYHDEEQPEDHEPRYVETFSACVHYPYCEWKSMLYLVHDVWDVDTRIKMLLRLGIYGHTLTRQDA